MFIFAILVIDNRRPVADRSSANPQGRLTKMQVKLVNSRRTEPSGLLGAALLVVILVIALGMTIAG